MKTPGQQLQESSSLAELGVENDEEVAVAYQRNGAHLFAHLRCRAQTLETLEHVLKDPVQTLLPSPDPAPVPRLCLVK